MSFPGLQILYGLINSYDDFYMERIFVPDSDMQDEIQKKNIPLFTIESWSYVSELNVLAFTLQYELSYTNILNIFELAKIPYLSEERGDEFPLVIAGGSGTLNPEPLSLAIDLFAIGDGEESFPKILKVYKDCIEKKMTKKESLRELAKIESVFIPSMHKKGKSVKRAEISDIENVYYETSPIVPNIDAVHKRAVVEIARGCPRKCNFCQAGNAYGNMRIRSIKKILELANKIINNTGYNELSLLSFSTSDYPHFNDLIQTLEKNFERKNIFYSLPSLRLDSFDEKILMNISTYKKTGLTFAPEAGTERLRKFLNKNILDEQIFELIRKIINLGFKKVKFYFMVGLPTETYKDLEAILSLIKKCMDISYEISEKGKRNFSLQVSVSNFVPKPHTPFEREKAFSVSELYKRNYYLKDNFAKMKGVRFSFYDPKLSHIEAILSRGDSKILSIIKDAYDMGAKFDSWTEYFKYEIWEEAFKKNGIDIDRDFSFKGDEKLPWEYIKI
jgi:radical SAM family uncharacterized protein